MDAFLRGLIAGYGIAIPVGPIAILILELGIRRGFAVAFCAGAGAASADLIYAAVAVLAGTFVVSILTPYSMILRIVSAVGLILLGVWLLYRGLPRSRFEIRSLQSLQGDCLRTYTMVLGLTLLNPVTVTYFTTLILGMGTLNSDSLLTSFVFVTGAFLASFSWQTLLAGMSGFAHKRFSTRLQTMTFTVGNLMIIGLGIAILLRFI